MFSFLFFSQFSLPPSLNLYHWGSTAQSPPLASTMPTTPPLPTKIPLEQNPILKKKKNKNPASQLTIEGKKKKNQNPENAEPERQHKPLICSST